MLFRSNRFYRIDLLEREGYLSEEDSITLKYFIRAPNFAQQSRDQKRYIDQVELQVKSLQQQLDEIKQWGLNELANKNKKKSSKKKKVVKQVVNEVREEFEVPDHNEEEGKEEAKIEVSRDLT